MSTVQIIMVAVFYLFAIVSGIILHKKGRPFNQLLSVAHKLLALVVIIVTIMLVRNALIESSISVMAIVSLAISFILFISLFVTGSMLSGNKEGPKIILILHDIATYTTIPLLILTFLLFK